VTEFAHALAPDDRALPITVEGALRWLADRV
jgi:hypothetical protein